MVSEITGEYPFLDCLAKLFTGMSLKRLDQWVQEKDVLNKLKAGCRKWYSNVDNIFNLLNIIKIIITK